MTFKPSVGSRASTGSSSLPGAPRRTSAIAPTRYSQPRGSFGSFSDSANSSLLPGGRALDPDLGLPPASAEVTRRGWGGSCTGAGSTAPPPTADSLMTTGNDRAEGGRRGGGGQAGRGEHASPRGGGGHDEKQLRRRETAVDHLVERHRTRWQQQWEHEQQLQLEPWRAHHRHPVGGGSELESPWTDAHIEALAYQGATLLMNGELVGLPGPPPNIAALGAALGGSTRPREDAGRWPHSPMPAAKLDTSRSHTIAHGSGALEKASAAQSLSCFVPPPASSTPAGQFARANASFLGAEVLRGLSPRANVQPPKTAPHRLHDSPAHLVDSASVRLRHLGWTS